MRFWRHVSSKVEPKVLETPESSSPDLLDEPINPAPTRNTFELVLTRILERKARAIEKGYCRFGDEYLTRLGERRDPRRYVDRDAAEVSRLALDFSRVNTGPNAEVVQSGDQVDRGGAANCSGSSIEHGQETVAGGCDLVTAEAVELKPDPIVVTPQKLFPSRIAHSTGDGGRIDDVRDKERRNDAFTGFSGLAEAAHPRELDGDDRLVPDDPGVVTGWHVEDTPGPATRCAPSSVSNSSLPEMTKP